jgi:uncharacterized repeat protein (TIGR02543 family)
MFNLKTKRLPFVMFTLLVLAACNDLNSTIPISSLSNSPSTSLSTSTSGVTSSSSSSSSSSMSSESSSTPSSSSELPSEEQYQIFLLAQQSGYTGTYQEWLDSIKGADGASLLNGTTNPTSSQGKNGDTFINTSTWDVYVKSGGNWTKVGNILGTKGADGEDGLSAYEIYIANYPDYQGDEEQWLEDLINGNLAEVQTFTVTFDSNGGTSVPSQEVKRLDKVTKPEDPTKTGYTFDGWYVEDEKWVFSGYNVTEDMTLTAQWTEIIEEEIGTEGLIYSQYIRNGNVEYAVTDYVGNDKDVVIPSRVNGYEVTMIADLAFAYTDTQLSYNFKIQINSIVLPSNLKTIGRAAFYYSRIKFVQIPKSVIKIDDFAFYTSPLAAVIIPNSVTTIGEFAFHGGFKTTYYLENNSTPEGWDLEWYGETYSPTFIFGTDLNMFGEENGFYYFISKDDLNNNTVSILFSTNKGTVTIPSTIRGYPVISIGRYSFNSNPITSLTIPNTVTTIGDWSFGFTQLTTLTIPNSVIKIGDGAFYGTQLTSLTIPNSVTNIGQYAFFDTQLTSVTIPNSVTTIGSSAFSHYNSEAFTIYVEAAVIPEGWNQNWFYSQNGSVNVVWDYKNQ